MRFLYQPVTPFIVTQGFGQNQGCVHNDTGRVISCDGHNPPSGFRSVYSNMKGHNGLDLRASHGQPVYAAANGKVIEVTTDNSGGLGVTLLHTIYEDRELRYYKTRYWHLKEFNVSVGERVLAGKLIGLADNTGLSAGDHLHFDLKRCDANGKTLDHGNGYLGAIDPTPFMLDKSAESIKWVRNSLNKGIISIIQALRWLT